MGNVGRAGAAARQLIRAGTSGTSSTSRAPFARATSFGNNASAEINSNGGANGFSAPPSNGQARRLLSGYNSPYRAMQENASSNFSTSSHLDSPIESNSGSSALGGASFITAKDTKHNKAEAKTLLTTVKDETSAKSAMDTIRQSPGAKSSKFLARVKREAAKSIGKLLSQAKKEQKAALHQDNKTKRFEKESAAKETLRKAEALADLIDMIENHGDELEAADSGFKMPRASFDRESLTGDLASEDSLGVQPGANPLSSERFHIPRATIGERLVQQHPADPAESETSSVSSASSIESEIPRTDSDDFSDALLDTITNDESVRRALGVLHNSAHADRLDTLMTLNQESRSLASAHMKRSKALNARANEAKQSGDLHTANKLSLDAVAARKLASNFTLLADAITGRARVEMR